MTIHVSLTFSGWTSDSTRWHWTIAPPSAAARYQELANKIVGTATAQTALWSADANPVEFLVEALAPDGWKLVSVQNTRWLETADVRPNATGTPSSYTEHHLAGYRLWFQAGR